MPQAGKRGLEWDEAPRLSDKNSRGWRHALNSPRGDALAMVVVTYGRPGRPMPTR
jgi:hypothetical protein